MWQKECARCRQLQMFGPRWVTASKNVTPGVVRMVWACPACDARNLFESGRRV